MTDDRSRALCEALAAAGSSDAAVKTAKSAVAKGFAPSTTVLLLDGIDAQAARIARSLYGSDADGSPAPADEERGAEALTPGDALNAEIRAAAGVVTVDEEPQRDGAQERTASQEMSHHIRAELGLVPPDQAA